MAQLNVLVSGAGIAGSVAAYWLAKAGMNVTVIEQAPELRTSGQGIDIRGKGVDVIRRMGVEEEIRAKTTKETGMMFVDDNNNTLATLGVDGDQSFTSDIEIIRSDLAKIFYNASLSQNVHYEFGTTIMSLTQTSSNVTVELSNGTSKTYDTVIAADGFGSRARSMILGPERSKAGIYSLDAFTAYFSIPHEPQDTPMSRWFFTTNRRALNLRPKNQDYISAYLNILTTDPRLREAQTSNDITKQKALWSDLFADVGWEAPRALKQMQNAGRNDFYFQEIGQIRLDPSSWHEGRCALVGDAAYCPSPFTGMGTTLAIVGAYTLAGEIAREARKTSPSTSVDVEAAFKSYESRLGDYVKNIQKLPGGGTFIKILNQQTAWGVWLVRNIIWCIDRSRIAKVASLFGGNSKDDGLVLPEYDF